MCGIVVGVADSAWDARVHAALDAINHRGPDARGYYRDGDAFLGHVRLSVMDPTSASDQPFRAGGTTVAYNGELWNYRALRVKLEDEGRRFYTVGDVEVVSHALDAWGVNALNEFDGMFAVAWLSGDGCLRVARDRFGEVPLHAAVQSPFVAASELRALSTFGVDMSRVEWVGPGEVWTVGGGVVDRHRWWRPGVTPHAPRTVGGAARGIRRALEVSCRDRSMTHVPAAFLLSGGVDSAAIVALTKDHLPGVPAYTAVLDPKSPDLRAARVTAEVLGVDLVEVPVPVPMLSDLEMCVRAAEMPHKAQVEIGWACLQLARRMRSDGVKVTFSGEGSDELWASYGFAYHGLKTKGWRAYREDLFLGQHRKNFARCNKIFMAHSIECRLPFLNPGLVELALSLPKDAVVEGRRSKAVLQDAVADVLPDLVVSRQKMAFQDGLGLKNAIASSIKNPKASYVRAFKREYPGVRI